MKIAICAALYEAGRPFLAEFVHAMQAAVTHGEAAAHDIFFVAAIDGLDNANEALADLAGHVDIVSVDVAAGRTPAGVRGAMLTTGQLSGTDILIFIDMDDLIAPQAIARHLEALREADFSYGDLDLVDASGRQLGRRFFDKASVPDAVDDVLSIRDRNFLGFSNTAVRTHRISPVALMVPESIVAADWWFFTMLLLGGLRGKKTTGPVAAYRLHDANILGAGAPRTVAQAIAQIEAMLLHYRAFSAYPALAERIDDTEHVLRALQMSSAHQIGAHLETSDDVEGTWFEGLDRIAENLRTEPLASAAAQ
ncbi:MAG: hypothetical protein OER92_03765 [Alphaproteobacteria bacterium]|nr:hypothetical protein [Alphaproteobacteria bacterium]